MAVRVSRIRYQITDDGATTTIRRIVSENERLKKSVEDLDKRLSALGSTHRKTAGASTVSFASSKNLAGGLIMVGGAAAAAATALALVGAATMGVARSAIAANARLQAQRENVRFLVKDVEQANVVLSRLDKLSRTPLGDAVYDSFERLVGGGAPIPRTLSLIEALGDAVGGNSQRFVGASTAISQMFAKGRVSAEELVQQLSEHGVPAVKILRDELGLTDKELQNIGNSGRSVDEVVDALERGMRKMSGGRLASMAAGPAGLLASFGASAGRLNARLGNIFEPATNKVIAGMIQLFEKLDASLAALGASPEFQAFLNDLIQLGRAVLPILLFMAEHLDEVVIGMLRFDSAIGGPISKLGALGRGIESTSRMLSGVGKGWEQLSQTFKKGTDPLSLVASLLKMVGSLLPPPIRLFLEENGVGAKLETILKNLSGGGAIKIPIEIATTVAELAHKVALVVLAVVAPSIGIPLILAELGSLITQRVQEAQNVASAKPVSIPTTFDAPVPLSVGVAEVKIPTSYAPPAELQVTPPMVEIPTTYKAPADLNIMAPAVAIPTQFASPPELVVSAPAVTVGVQFQQATLNIPTPATVVIPTEFGRPGEGGSGVTLWSGSSGASGQGATVTASGQVSAPSTVTISAPAHEVVPEAVQSVVGETAPGDMATQTFGTVAAILGIGAAGIGAAMAAGVVTLVEVLTAAATLGGARVGRGGGCFAAGTLVATPVGDRAIETLAVGDPVYRWSHERRALVVTVVTATLVHDDCALLRVTLDGGATIDVTAEHLVWTGSAWRTAGSLAEGDAVWLGSGQGTLVRSVEALPVTQRVYNLHVDAPDFDGHNYVAGGTVVHNFKTPGFATGTDFAPGGAALVGERGPELVNLPRGSQVVPNHKLGGMTGGGEVHLHMHLNGGTYTTDAALAQLAERVAGEFVKRQRLTQSIALTRL